MIQPAYILYIDDLENQRSFKALFRRKFPIITTAGLKEARELIGQYRFKIVLANQHKPMNEISEFMHWLKQIEPEIIQIFIYSNDNIQTREHIKGNIAAPAHQHLWKPWNTKEMESILRKWWN